MANQVNSSIRKTRHVLVVAAIVCAVSTTAATAPGYGRDRLRLPSTVHQALKANGWKVVSDWRGIVPLNSDAFESHVSPRRDSGTRSKYPQGGGTLYRRWVITGEADDSRGARHD